MVVSGDRGADCKPMIATVVLRTFDITKLPCFFSAKCIYVGGPLLFVSLLARIVRTCAFVSPNCRRINIRSRH